MGGFSGLGWLGRGWMVWAGLTHISGASGRMPEQWEWPEPFFMKFFSSSRRQDQELFPWWQRVLTSDIFCSCHICYCLIHQRRSYSQVQIQQRDRFCCLLGRGAKSHCKACRHAGRQEKIGGNYCNNLPLIMSRTQLPKCFEIHLNYSMLIFGRGLCMSVELDSFWNAKLLPPGGFFHAVCSAWNAPPTSLPG